MHAILLGVTWGMIGLDSGWKALPGGGIEYILQISRQELELFKQDQNIEVDIPPKLREIHTLRVVVGSDVLPREDPVKTPATAASAAKPPSASGGLDLRRLLPSQGKTAAYQPFAALTSLWDKYPFPQNASDPTDRSATRDTAPTRRIGSGRQPIEQPPQDEPPPFRDGSKARPRDIPQLPGSAAANGLEGRAETGTKEPGKASSKEPAKNTGPFTVVVLVLLGSLGGNVYMGWITWETRARYHALVHRRKKGEHHSGERIHEFADANEE